MIRWHGIARNEDVAIFKGGVVSWSELRGLGLGLGPSRPALSLCLRAAGPLSFLLHSSISLYYSLILFRYTRSLIIINKRNLFINIF